MKRSKCSDEQILAIVKEAEAGRKVADRLSGARYRPASPQTAASSTRHSAHLTEGVHATCIERRRRGRKHGPVIDSHRRRR